APSISQSRTPTTFSSWTSRGLRMSELPPGDGDQPSLIFGDFEPIEIQEEMERSFLDYSMSVITQRALPDVKDGLKPVQRRILWGMYDIGARPDRSHMKCARVTGDVMGKYHPHGEGPVYDARGGTHHT